LRRADPWRRRSTDRWKLCVDGAGVASGASGSQLGVAFRRQVVLGEYIVDFLAPACRLVVEVDGPYHARRLRADARRDARLRALGFRVLHLEGELVMRDLTMVLERIRDALDGVA
jgi:very-short-patch-repair endonuclease